MFVRHSPQRGGDEPLRFLGGRNGPALTYSVLAATRSASFAS
jgi:hypothetical protein